MQSSLQRLDCYDRLFRGKLAAPVGTKADQKPAAPITGSTTVTGKTNIPDNALVTNSNGKSAKFESRTEVNAVKPGWVLRNEAKGKLVATQSQRVHRNLVGHKSRLSLEISCKNNITSLELRFGGNIVASFLDTARVQFSVDDRPAVSYLFSVASDFKAIGLWTGEEAIPVIKSLMGARTLAVEGAPYFSRPVKAGFLIHGLNSTIRPIRGSCKW